MDRNTTEASFLAMVESTCDGAVRGRLRMRGQSDRAPTAHDHRRETTRWEMEKRLFPIATTYIGNKWESLLI